MYMEPGPGYVILGVVMEVIAGDERATRLVCVHNSQTTLALFDKVSCGDLTLCETLD
jgi:hypothetical protein